MLTQTQSLILELREEARLSRGEYIENMLSAASDVIEQQARELVEARAALSTINRTLHELEAIAAIDTYNTGINATMKTVDEVREMVRPRRVD